MNNSEPAGIDHRTAAEILDQREAATVRKAYQLIQPRAMSEANDLEIAGVDPQEGRRAGSNRGFVIVHISAIGGAHFHKLGAALTENVGDPKAAADLYQLAP